MKLPNSCHSLALHLTIAYNIIQSFFVETLTITFCRAVNVFQFLRLWEVSVRLFSFSRSEIYAGNVEDEDEFKIEIERAHFFLGFSLWIHKQSRVCMAIV